MKKPVCLLFAAALLLGTSAVANAVFVGAESFTLYSNRDLDLDVYKNAATVYFGTGYGGTSGALPAVPPDTFSSATLTITEQSGDSATWYAWIGNGTYEPGTYIGNHQFTFTFTLSDFGSTNWYSNPLAINIEADCRLESGSLVVSYNIPEVPEPSTILLFSLGIIGLGLWKFRAA
jgi:hypothetical protein